MMKNFLKRPDRGFTLVETLIAISILTAIIAGAMSAVQTVFQSYNQVKNEAIATYLAQEGIEQIRSIRDENRIEGHHWLEGIAEQASDPCSSGKVCRVSPAEGSEATECPSGNCPQLKQDSDTGIYGYSNNAGWNNSPFKREIRVNSVNADEVVVEVTMTWSRGTLKMSENLINWQ